VAGFEEGWLAFETIESAGVVVKYLGFGVVLCTLFGWKRGFSTKRADAFTGVKASARFGRNDRFAFE
jgi:hypothetical protein